MKDLVHNDKILLRLASDLTYAMDQTIHEQVPHLNRSEFIRRALRFTIDNIDDFKGSEALKIAETQGVEVVDKINAVRTLYTDLIRYTEDLQKDPSAPLPVKQLAFLNRIVGTMVFKMQD